MKKVRSSLQQVRSRSVAWYLVGIDLIGELKPTKAGHKYILTMVDYYTKWPEAIPLKNKDGLTVARAIYENIYTRYGPPSRLISDNGTEFCNQVRNEKITSLSISE